MTTPETSRRIKAWLDGPFDEETKAEILRLSKSHPELLSDAFFKDLSFGTGGMRGVMGVGTNRMNIYTVRSATQGLASYLLKQAEENPSVFIGYDVRKNSRLFAEEAGRTLAGNGIRVFIASEVCPTPLVSFACRHFGCSAAIVITASHNPPAYNGYKVYWKDGSQVVAPHDVGIMAEVKKNRAPLLASKDSPLIQFVGDEIDAAYLKELKKLRLHPELKSGSLKIVYTNLHGTGLRLMPDALKTWGFKAPSLVGPQANYDGTFSTVSSPNPEEEKALRLGIEQMMKEGADLLIATDPDADRMGAAVREKKGATRLSGNQIACLCLYHICSSLQAKNEFPENAGFIKSIVTTELFKAIAESFGGTSVDVLTGFKYIGEKIHLWEESFSGLQFLFGAEESYGYLFGTFVRDKDSISSACLLAEVAEFAKRQNMNLIDLLHKIYQKYGVYRESLTNLSFPESQSGMEEMGKLMLRLRSNPPSEIGGSRIVLVEDFLKGLNGLPPSDVLRFWLEEGTKLVIRPSGTEPKVKIYAEVIEKGAKDLKAAIERCDQKLKAVVQAFTSAL
jgi:phosphoglucomutase/phosphomannomutase